MVASQGNNAALRWFVNVIDEVITGLDRAAAYVDDVIVFDADRSAYVLNIVKDLFQRCENTTSSFLFEGYNSVPLTRIYLETPAGAKLTTGKVKALKKTPIPCDTKQATQKTIAPSGKVDTFRYLPPNNNAPI